MHDSVGKRRIAVRPIFSPDCVFDAYVNAELNTQSKLGELYSFDVPDNFVGAKTIEVVVHQGSITIEEQSSFGEYALLNGDTWWKVDLMQCNFIEWFKSNDKKLPIKISAGEKLKFKHFIPRGASYLKSVYNYER